MPGAGQTKAERTADVLPLRRTSAGSSQNFRNYFEAREKSYRAIPPPRVVLSNGYIQAVRKHCVRAGGN